MTFFSGVTTSPGIDTSGGGAIASSFGPKASQIFATCAKYSAFVGAAWELPLNTRTTTAATTPATRIAPVEASACVLRVTRRRMPRAVFARGRAGKRTPVSLVCGRLVLVLLEHSGLSLTTENRLIDLAITGTLGKCHDCFEALEALRPIPSLQQHQCS